jgi:uncharacterized protein (DUF697 family)/tellurite resistance protein
MNTTDHAPLIAIAMLAARADGSTDSAEQAAVNAVVARMGSPDVSRLAEQVAGGQIRAADLARKLSDDEARQTAYDGALAICNADGPANAAELAFLEELRDALGISAPPPVAEVHSGAPPAGPLDDFILQQAILTGALEILPDQMANIAILPLQLRLVYQIGQRHGQKLDVNQVKDLAATLGLGVAAQGVESVVMGLVGGLARGLLGGLAGGATRVATGAAISFSATYALGHVADQYYAQGRNLSRNDLLALFDRFKQDAKTIYPRVQSQIQTKSGSLNLQSLLAGLRGA